LLISAFDYGDLDFKGLFTFIEWFIEKPISLSELSRMIIAPIFHVLTNLESILYILLL